MEGRDTTLEEGRKMPPPLPNNNNNTDSYNLPTTYAEGKEGRREGGRRGGREKEEDAEGGVTN